MPTYSTLRSFVKAITTGDTNITKTLERLSNDDAKRKKYATDLDAPHLAVGQLPGWLRNEMVQTGMSQPEVDHVERWPDRQKEIARAQIVAAISGVRPIRFSWELYDGNDPITEVRRDTDGEVRLVFRSPRKGVKLSLVNLGGVTVEA